MEDGELATASGCGAPGQVPAAAAVALTDLEVHDPSAPPPQDKAVEAAEVPRSQRRGLLGRLSLVPEVTDPYQYSRRVKWFITFIIAMAAAAAPMGSAIFFPALPELSRDLHTTPTITNLSVALYMLAMSIFPLWWSSFSETQGRRSIYLISFALFIGFNIVCAVSSSISMLIVMRILVGGSAASVQAVGAGTIADIWEARERGQAMGIFYLGPLTGPLLAPIIGGALAQRWGWRATTWFLAIWGVIVWVAIVFYLPETLKACAMSSGPRAAGEATMSGATLSRTSTRQKVQEVTKKRIMVAKRIFIDPLKVILYLRHPAVLITVYYASITFGSLYVLNVSIQDTFSKTPYNFSTIIIGLLYIPNSLGYFLASYLGGRWTDFIMDREARAAGRYDEKGRPIFRPEDRMRENAWLAAIMYPVALMTANFFFGIGSMIIFGTSTTMLTEFMPPRKSSSGVALNNFVRNIFSAVGGIVTAPLIDGGSGGSGSERHQVLGNGWLFTILGLWALVSGVGTIVALRRFGPRWRETEIS
ncbi:MAG: hypothetical protein M1838_006158 [Thelocarpon superellum]|nr:MAG: hypothetical protein M1838_006158 [Thelocarpon superellum]